MSVIGSNALAGASGQGSGGGFVIEKSLRFNSGDSANLSRTPSSSSNRNKYTWSCWVKRCQLGSTTHYLFSAQDGSNVDFLGFEADSIMWYNAYSGGVTSTDKFRDTSAWYHVVFSVDSTQATAADRVKIYVNNRQITSFSSSLYPSQNRDFAINHTVAHSIGHYGGSYSSNFYLAEVHFVDGQVLTPADFAAYDDNNVWQAKKYTGTYGTNGFHLDFADGSNIGNDAAGSNNWTANNLITLPFEASISDVTVFKQGAVASNGNPQNMFDGDKATFTYASGSTTTNYIEWAPTGGYTTSGYIWVSGGDGGAGGLDGMTVTINGTTVTRTAVVDNESYSDPNYEWGDWSKFSVSGNTLNTLRVTGANALIRQVSTVADPTHSVLGISDDNDVPVLLAGDPGDLDLLFDSPTNGDATADTGAGGEVSGNYCTLNPLHELTGGYDLALSNGNLEVTNGGDATGTLTFGSGKKYFELTVKSASGFSQGYYGIVNIADHIRPRAWSTSQIAALRDSGSLYGDGSTGSAPAATQVGDVYGFAVDVDNQKLFISVNGTYLNNADPASGTGASFTGRDFSNYAPLASLATTNSQTIVLNAGQRTFNTAAPSGYKALCTANLPTPDIADGSAYFDAKLYDGNGSTNAITGLEFSPDLVWLKSRTAARSHCLFDTVRGVNKRILSNTNDEQYTVANTLTSFDNNGFTLGSNNEANNSGESLVAWAWDAGTSNTTVSAGSLNSSLYDQSQTWSTYGTFDNNWSNSAYHWDDVFNTTLTNNGAGALYVDGTTKDTWNLSSSYAVSNTIKVYTQNPTEITINEGLSSEKVVTSDGGNTLHYFEFSFTGNVESVGVRHASGGGIYLMGIWFDGKQLVDDTETPANLPSLASTYRANPSSGFSIVNYTSNAGNLETIAHGLGVAPEFVLCKRLDTAGDWWAGHVGAGWDTGGYLQASDAFATAPNWWQSTAPTSQLVTLGSYPLTGSSGNYIAYCWAPVSGYSAFGSYTGNGASDGPFVALDFQPAFILIKSKEYAGNWFIYDNGRFPNNPKDARIYANTSGAESAVTDDIDFLANGFKIRTASVSTNGSGNTHIYAAFAENPFQANGGLAR